MVSSKSYVRAGRHASKEGKTAAYEYLPHTDVSILMVDYDCRRMRESVNKLLTRGSFTKDELCKAVACSAASVHFPQGRGVIQGLQISCQCLRLVLAARYPSSLAARLLYGAR